KMGVTVFASPWEPPANLAESGGSNGKLHLPKSNYAAYAKHLNDFGTYMKSNGVDLYAVSVQNEPDYASEWTYWSTDETTDFIANYGDQITSTRLMSPESFQYAPENASWVADGGKTFYRKILNNSKAMENCDLFGTHFYGTQRAWMDFPDLENSGKEIWMTEVYVPNSEQDSANRYPEALQVSENIHNAMVVGNMSAYTWWYIRRHYGLMTEDGKISKRGYCMAQYSKYVRPGDVRIDATEQPADNVYVSAYKGDDNQVTIVAINKGTESYSQQFAVDADAQITEVDRYRTSASENLAKTGNMEHDSSSFWAQLPAESVSTFVVTLEDKPVEPDKNGYYFHDTFEADNCDWQGHGAADIALSGRIPYQGTNALLVQNRASAWNGAEKTLPAKAFQAGKEYSFSVCLNYMDGESSKNAALSLQYTNSAGEVKYARIASASATKNNYVQLANQAFQLPEDGKDFKIYVEMENDTDNFYIDEAIGAVKGTIIKGPPVETTTTVATTTATTTTTITMPTVTTTKITTTISTPTAEAQTAFYGDINLDGSVTLADLILFQKQQRGVLDLNEQQKRNANCDLTDSAITPQDVTTLLNFLIGKINQLPFQ
ncbi:MAG: carbohydrate binding domain-containing protein, partial [Ruminococcus sp.]